MAQPASNKKVVQVEETDQPTTSSSGGGTGTPWKPDAASKGRATTFRIIAAVLWILALGGEAFAVFYLLKQNPVNTVFLIIAIVVIGLLAVGGSLLWKQANKLDPASKADKARFFVQNQLGAIITVICFLPLIILIFFDKNMSGQQKGLAGGIGIVVLLVAGFFGVSINPPSTEQYQQIQATASPGAQDYPEETAAVEQLTGKDEVFWTKAGTVYHLCQNASAVNLTSKDNQIYEGTVDAAHEAGKQRLTLEVSEELKQCGITTASPTP